MGLFTLGLLAIIGIGGGAAYYVHKQGENQPTAEGGEEKKSGMFGFGKKKEGEAEKKEEGGGWKMPSMPNQNSMKMMMMKQSMTNAFK
ncbi:expressed unknown protein [Seminavis robusta]|uniref:Uncharacterized protein n=1 Tax=Seminavis robusta TaxID=568900 RepID=A0A9N8DIN7_9STRA|nr:expressed unknown protein [Seminavis robusta]|eukprot:Sro141_g065970.1 n/a (88) ;mRNA; f:100006-100269